ncbi:MAG TPA: hypothetical protein VHC97_12395 [Thermoanaerobaculia bacterium]|nr:hypothetical protein [Thermoanaerobaculia bacterium]
MIATRAARKSRNAAAARLQTATSRRPMARRRTRTSRIRARAKPTRTGGRQASGSPGVGSSYSWIRPARETTPSRTEARGAVFVWDDTWRGTTHSSGAKQTATPAMASR